MMALVPRMSECFRSVLEMFGKVKSLKSVDLIAISQYLS